MSFGTYYNPDFHEICKIPNKIQNDRDRIINWLNQVESEAAFFLRATMMLSRTAEETYNPHFQNWLWGITLRQLTYVAGELLKIHQQYQIPIGENNLAYYIKDGREMKLSDFYDTSAAPVLKGL